MITRCVYYYGSQELNALIVDGRIYFDAQDIAACLGYVQSKDKRKHTGWQWTLCKEMPSCMKQSVTPNSGRTVYYYSVAGVMWLEKRVTSKARRKIARALRADFYDWFYKVFPYEVLKSTPLVRYYEAERCAEVEDDD